MDRRFGHLTSQILDRCFSFATSGQSRSSPRLPVPLRGQPQEAIAALLWTRRESAGDLALNTRGG